MCNLSQGLIEEGRVEGRKEGRVEGRKEGRVEGRKEGRKEGRIEGREEERITSIRNVMSNLKTTAEKAMDILGIPASERGRYIAML